MRNILHLFTPALFNAKFKSYQFMELLSIYGLDTEVRIHSSIETLPLDEAWGMLVRLPNCHLLSATKAAKRNLPSLFEAVRADMLDLLRERDGFLLLEMGYEAFFGRDDIFQDLHEAIKSNLHPNQRVLILHCNLAIPVVYANWCRNRGVQQRVEFLARPVGLWLFCGYAQRDRAQYIDPDGGSTSIGIGEICKGKRFVSINGGIRPHRLYLAMYLHANKLLDKTSLSLLGKPYSTQSLAVYQKMLRNLPQFETLRHSLEPVLSRVPLELDVSRVDFLHEGAYATSLCWSVPPTELYDDAEFSIVTDTLFFDANMLFVTEKVMKSLVRRSPFVYFGNPGGLAFLQGLGFASYEPLISQDYDTLVDANERLVAIFEQIRRLAELSDRKARHLAEDLRERASANAIHAVDKLPMIFRADICGMLDVIAQRARRDRSSLDTIG